MRSGLLRVPAAGVGGVLSCLEPVQRDERLRARGAGTGGLHLGDPRYSRVLSIHSPACHSRSSHGYPRDLIFYVVYFCCLLVSSRFSLVLIFTFGPALFLHSILAPSP